MIKKILRFFINYYYAIKNINKYSKYKKEKKIIYLLKPNHGNIGDQAIAYATTKFYEKYFPDYKILHFDRDSVYREYFAIKNCMNKDDFIILHGGGNMGNLYVIEEKVRRFVIKKFKYSKIVSMTQTLTFTDDFEGKNEKRKTVRVYNAHKNLLLISREDKSFKQMVNLFNCKVLNAPDIVLFLSNKLNLDSRRTLITTALRNDKESVLLDKKDFFIQRLKKEEDNVFIYDTNINRDLNIEDRENEIMEMWNNFKSSKVVITDRLHGMIFCVITRTPCIVLRSLDHKVAESYKWVSNLDFIKLVDDLDYDKLKVIIDKFNNIKVNYEISFDSYFDNLAKEIRLFLQ